MRITTQMINETAKKTGIPVQQTSLLDYINKEEDSGSDSLLSVLQAQESGAVSTANQTKYAKQEKAADALTAQAQKLTESGDESIWQKAKTSGSTSDICTAAENLADQYNSLLSALNTSTDTLDQFYAKSLKELAEESGTELSAIGISVKSDGSLSADSQKLSAASLEDLENILGADSTFMQHLSYVAGRIGDNAASNLESMTSSYSSSGTLTGSYTSKYDFLG